MIIDTLYSGNINILQLVFDNNVFNNLNVFY